MSNQLNFFEFQRKFSTDLRCYNFLVKKRWPNGYQCPKCGNTSYSYHSTRKLYQCKSCGYQVSVTAGTIFHKTRTPLRKWFWMIYLITTNKTGVSISYLQRMLNIKSYRTVWTIAHKIFEAMNKRDLLYQLDGLIEMDESYFGSKNVSGKRGRGAGSKSPVIIAVGKKESKDKKIYPTFVKMEVIENVKKETIKEFVKNNILARNTKIETDKFSSYKWLTENGYEHNAMRIYNPKETLNYLPWVHILIGNAKGILRGIHHGVSSHYLKRYLSEFCYKFNRRFFKQNIFYNLITTCVNTSPITFAELKT